MIDAADYKERNKAFEGKMKFKFKSINYSLVDINNWLKNANEPDMLYVKRKHNDIVIIEVSYETKGKNGPFINRKIYINDDLIEEEKIEDVVE